MPEARPPGDASGRFGPYRVLRRLAEGATGSVHLAVDERSGQTVAVKLVSLSRSDVAAEEARRRFLVEAQAARRLRHPDIAAVLDAGESHGIGWLAMELAPGCDLGRYCRPPRLLPLPLVLHIGARVAGALAHAHAAGIVHRDIKPGNVVVHLPGDTVKLVDFGVARIAGAEATRTGVVLGSPAYLAPEQLAGAQPDAATDLYALGVLLFHLCTGRLPFRAQSMGELLREVAIVPAPDLRGLVADCPPELATLVAGLLSKTASQRPSSAADVAARLGAMAGLPGAAGRRAGDDSAHP